MKTADLLQKVYHRKAALRKTFLDIDESKPPSSFTLEKSGLLLSNLFFDILGYNHIALAPNTVATLTRHFVKQNRILYKEALA